MCTEPIFRTAGSIHERYRRFVADGAVWTTSPVSALGWWPTPPCPASGVRVARELDAIIDWRGKPAAVVSDNCTELTSIEILKWQQETGIGWHYISPHCPAGKRSAAERGKAKTECLRGKLQRPIPGRMPERKALFDIGGRQSHNLTMKGGLKLSQASVSPRQSDVRRIRQQNLTGKAGRMRSISKPGLCAKLDEVRISGQKSQITFKRPARSEILFQPARNSLTCRDCY